MTRYRIRQWTLVLAITILMGTLIPISSAEPDEYVFFKRRDTPTPTLTPTSTPTPTPGAEVRLASQLDKILGDPRLEDGFWGAMVQSVDRGDILYTQNAGKAFLPASNMKLFTTAAALALLGPDYKFETKLLSTDANVADGVVNGDLYVVGTGDPTVMGAFHDGDTLKPLRDVARVLRLVGIKQIAGNIVGDDNALDDLYLIDSWWYGDLSISYAAEPGALNVNGNCYDVTVAPGDSVGAPVIAHTVPPSVYGEFIISATTATPDANASLHCVRRVDTNIIEITGQLPLGSQPVDRGVTIHNSTLFYTSLLKFVLELEGIEVTGQPLDIDDLDASQYDPSTMKVLAGYESAPLSEMIDAANKPSQNFITNQLLKTLGRRSDRQGSFQEGIKVVKQFLEVNGIDTQGFIMVDGSGMSRINYVRPEHLIGLLRVMAKHPHFQLYYDSLPVAGVDGTLKNRMRGTAAEGNVHAKTGHVGRVSTLSGYVTTKDGEKLAFSLMANNYTASSRIADGIQNRICALLAEFTRQ